MNIDEQRAWLRNGSSVTRKDLVSDPTEAPPVVVFKHVRARSNRESVLGPSAVGLERVQAKQVLTTSSVPGSHPSPPKWKRRLG